MRETDSDPLGILCYHLKTSRAGNELHLLDILAKGASVEAPKHHRLLPKATVCCPQPDDNVMLLKITLPCVVEQEANKLVPKQKLHSY